MPSRGSALEPDTDQSWLRATQRPLTTGGSSLVAVDLFAGCGGMSLGFWEAARRCGANMRVALAVESDIEVGKVFSRNFRGRVMAANAARLFNGTTGEPASARETAFANAAGRVDILLGGPPCQGHSDLNNHTRRSDPKNALYLKMARAAEIISPPLVVIENVPPVQWDVSEVVPRTEAALRKLGYRTQGGVVDSQAAGVPQGRKRFIMIASRLATVDPTKVLADLSEVPMVRRTVRWAIEDLVDAANTDAPSPLDRPSKTSERNAQRIQYLVDNGLVDLPNAERPKCHRDDPEHSYKSMYGRLSWDKPAQTITTGFSSMGQGRFVHPSRSRTLTPHEAARLQTFPDWFDWGTSKRGVLSKMIGNAVPAFLGVELGLALLPAVLQSKGERSA